MDDEFSTLKYWEKFGRFSGLAVIATDKSGTVRVWSEGAEKLYGWTVDEAIGVPIQELTVGPLERSVAEDIMQQVMQGRPWEGDFHARTRHGKIAEVHVLDFPLVDVDGVPAGIVGLSFDVSSGRVGSLNNLVNLRHLAREIHDARQEERSKIARDLHDDLGQILTMLRTEISGHWEGTHAHGECHGHYGSLLEKINLAITAVRTISGELLDRNLDVWSLILRAFEMTDSLQTRTGILSSCEVFGSVDMLRAVEPPRAVSAFHVLREALTNCERHSRATHVEVVIRVTDSHLVVMVEDNGVGIDPATEGIGLRIMRERLAQVCGSLKLTNLESEGLCGTRVRVLIPSGPAHGSMGEQ